MEKKTIKLKNKNHFKFLIVVFFFSFLFLTSNKTSADDTNCKDLSGDAEKQCLDLEKKAKVYQDIIALKNKQQDTLAVQLGSIDQQQEKNKLALIDIQKQLIDLDQKIKDLERSINDRQLEIDSQKKILSVLMQNYYEYDQQGLLGLMLVDKDFSDSLSQSDYTQQSSTRVSEILGNIQIAKNELVSQSEELNQKRKENNTLKDQLADKKSDLQSSEIQKQSLLVQTQGEEAKYKDLLAHVEEQKKELFNFSDASNLDEINASVDKYPKPKDHLASTSWYFSQKDSRWGGKKIGNSSSLMKDYGCAVTSLAMVFREKGSSIDPGKMASQKIFYYDLIKWPSSWSPGIALTSSISHGNISWKTIDSEIGKGDPVIVYIRKTNGRGGHYVVITGKDSKDYIVHDPYFGANLYLSTSKALVGKIGIDSSVRVDQMILYH
jgi:hypothetical protein